MGIIYKATNIVDGLVYIGQTKAKYLCNRKAQHKYDAIHHRKGDGCLFHEAIRQNGMDAFKWEIVERVDEAQLDERENYYIEQYAEVSYNVKGVY